jgi:anti-sigma regulatory factor (Ser/Thr protein kinase)
MTVIMREPGTLPAQPRCRTDVLELGAYDSAVPSARLHTRAVLGEWHLDDLLDEGESVVAEIVANAVQATRDAELDTGIRLTLVADDEGVLVVVWDAVPLPPRLENPDADSEHGRGLLIVQALSVWFDCRPVSAAHGGGKLVRSRIALPATTPRSA